MAKKEHRFNNRVSALMHMQKESHHLAALFDEFNNLLCLSILTIAC